MPHTYSSKLQYDGFMCIKTESCTICLYYLLPFLQTNISAGLFYKLIESKDKQNCVADKEPHIHKEFFQCSREQSCTHVVRLLDKCMLVYGSSSGKHEATYIYKKMNLSSKFNL